MLGLPKVNGVTNKYKKSLEMPCKRKLPATLTTSSIVAYALASQTNHWLTFCDPKSNNG